MVSNSNQREKARLLFGSSESSTRCGRCGRITWCPRQCPVIKLDWVIRTNGGEAHVKMNVRGTKMAVCPPRHVIRRQNAVGNNRMVLRVTTWRRLGRYSVRGAEEDHAG